MPWAIRHDKSGWWVVKKDSGKRVHKKAHSSKAKARRHLAAIRANYHKKR